MVKLSPVSYIGIVKSETLNRQIDLLEDLVFNDTTEICQLNDISSSSDIDTINQDNKQCISFDSHEDYQFVKEIYDECLLICNNVLSLNSLIRDYYVSGIRKSIGNKRNLQLSHEILKQFSTTAIISDDFMLDNNSNPTHSNSMKAKSQVIETRSNAKCFYCDISSTLDPSRKFAVHPYVPQSSKSTAVVMCLICLENWKEYRDKAELENELILNGQVNEEICCLCADTPLELILCDTCPRSYCRD